jgi:hypothetical protein
MQRHVDDDVTSSYLPANHPARMSPKMFKIVGGAALIGLLLLALGEKWVALSAIAPLLYILPCAVMMFMCMKGMNHGRNEGSGDAESQAPASPSSSIET